MKTVLKMLNKLFLCLSLIITVSCSGGDLAAGSIESAFKLEDLEKVRYFIDKSLKTPNELRVDGLPILHLAIAKQNIDLVRIVLSYGVDIEKNALGKPIFWTVLFDECDPSIVELLILNGVDLSVTSFSGDNLLHVAVEKGFLDCAMVFYRYSLIQDLHLESQSKFHGVHLIDKIQNSTDIGMIRFVECTRLMELHTLMRDTLITYRGSNDINKTQEQNIYAAI